MAEFSDTVRNWTLAVEANTQDVFVNTCAATLESIQDGSLVTGAPGQPVQTGRLRASWTLSFMGMNAALISTNVVYAPFIEDGVSGRGKALTLRSQVGGFHSVAMTVMNFDRIVYAIARGLPVGRAKNRPRDAG